LAPTLLTFGELYQQITAVAPEKEWMERIYVAVLMSG
jgi:hypothetical protein